MEKQERKKKMILIILIFIAFTALLIIVGLLAGRSRKDHTLYSDREVSENQSDLVVPSHQNRDEDAYTELMGFGCLDIDEDYPFIYLINPSENEVYLSFDVIYNGETLYQSALIAPGKMEQFDIYSCLNAGRHTLTYSVASYDLENKAVLWSGIRQDQEVSIIK